MQATHEQRPGSAPELNQFNTLFDDDNWAGLLLAQVELQSEDFMLPGEGFGLPGDGLALPTGSAQEAVKPQTASVYHIQANCSTEVRPVHFSPCCGNCSPPQPSTLAVHKAFQPSRPRPHPSMGVRVCEPTMIW